MKQSAKSIASSDDSDILGSYGVHSGTFFLLAIQSLGIIQRRLDDTKPYFVERLHLGTMPLTMLLTSACRKAWPDHTPPINTPQQWRKAVFGAGLAATCLGGCWGIETALGWMRWKGWGFHHYSLSRLIRSATFFATTHAAVAYNEETVFRGHGFTILSKSIGPWAAGGILMPLFAAYHPLDRPWIAMSAYSLFAFNHTMMRNLSGSLAMPMAYHWTWNWLQLGVVGGRSEIPSLLPVEINGPEIWTGKLGESYPGILMIIVQAVLATILGWLGWKARKRQ